MFTLCTASITVGSIPEFLAYSYLLCSLMLNVDCGMPDQIEGTVVSVQSTTYGSQATYTCAEGYKGPAEGSALTCRDDGVWGGEFPACTQICNYYALTHTKCTLTSS